MTDQPICERCLLNPAEHYSEFCKECIDEIWDEMIRGFEGREKEDGE